MLFWSLIEPPGWNHCRDASLCGQLNAIGEGEEGI